MNITAIILALAVMAVLGVLFGVVLTIADKKFAVEVDPRVSAVRECLGGANCGACGYAGCDAFAQAVVDGEAPVTGCTPGGAKAAEAIGLSLSASVCGAWSLAMKSSVPSSRAAISAIRSSCVRNGGFIFQFVPLTSVFSSSRW